MCNYCEQTYSKNATKMQVHLTKCKKYSLLSSAPDGSSSASIPVPSLSFLPSSTPGGQFLIDSVDQSSQAFADECLARAVYATASPLSLTQDVYWRRFFNVLRPAYCPPTRQALSTHLLDAGYDKMHRQVKETIGKADCVTVTSCGWSNLNETGVIHYVASTPLPLLYKSTEAEESARAAASIAEQLKAVVNEIGPQKVFAVVTDDAPDMQAAWALVEEAFPHVTAMGCTAHGLDQLARDVLGLQTMRTLLKRAEQVVSLVRGSQMVAETYCLWQKAKNKTGMLTLTGNAKGVSVVPFYTSLLEGKDSLQEIAISLSLDVEASVRSTLQEAAFWQGLASTRNLLSHVASAIDYIKREDAVLSDVVKIFADLRERMSASLPSTLLHSSEKEAVIEFINRHREFCVKPIHAAAYMLDPKYVNRQILSGEQINSAYYVISNLSHHLNLEEGRVLGSFAKFSTKQGLWKGDGIWDSCRHVSASTWWRGLCSSEPLSQVASILLQIPPSLAASGGYSSHFASSKMHSGLSTDKVQKLVALRANLNLLEPSDQEFAPLEFGEGEEVHSFGSESQ